MTFPLTSSETDGPIIEKSREKVEPLSLTLPLKNGLPYSPSSFSLFLWITLNHTLKRRKLHPSFLYATCPFLDFFSSFSLFLFIFRSLHFSIIPHLSLLFFFSLIIYFSKFSLRHINLFTIDLYVPILQFPYFLFFSLEFISGFHKFLILAYNHLSNLHLTIPRKIPELAQLYPEYIIIFIIKILGYF